MKEMCKKERTQNEGTLVKPVRSIICLLYATAIAQINSTKLPNYKQSSR